MSADYGALVRIDFTGEVPFEMQSMHALTQGFRVVFTPPVKITQVTVAEDGRSVELTTASLVKDRVYMLTAEGVRSTKDEKLVHTVGAYTLNEIPAN